MLVQLWKSITFRDIIIFILVLHAIYSYCNLNTIKEGFGGAIDYNAIKTLAQTAVKLQQGGLTVPGNLTVNGKLTVNNGSHFKGGRHYFQDSEGAAPLRVGAAWGQPGIYAEWGKDLILGGSSGRTVVTHNDLHINRNTHIGHNMEIHGNINCGSRLTVHGNQGAPSLIVNNGSRFNGDLHLFRDAGSPSHSSLTVGSSHGISGIHATGGGKLYIGRDGWNVVR